jgi:phosphatidylglycerophosphate synthase
MDRRAIRAGDWISLGRVPLALLFIALFRAQPGPLLTASIIVACAAQISDHVDGYLVRRLDSPSVIGWLFDSVSDRAFYMGAILAFEREFGINEFVVWLFVMREIVLYAVRVAVGDFERAYPGFRKLALLHAVIIRVAIVLGCALPFQFMPSAIQVEGILILNSLFFASAVLGYGSLTLLLKSEH